MKKDAEDLFERYFQQARLSAEAERDLMVHLKDDVIALKERKEGHELSAEELGPILESEGRSPISLRANFAQPRYGIDPALFSRYTGMLTVIGLACSVLWVYKGEAVLFSPTFRQNHPGWGLLVAFQREWVITSCSILIATLLFVLLVRFPIKWARLDAWNWRWLLRLRSEYEIPRLSSVTGLSLNGLFLSWWFSMFQFQVLALSSWRISFITVFSSHYCWPIAALSLALLSVNVATCIWPWWTRRLATIRLSVYGPGLIMLILLLRTGLQSATMTAKISPPTSLQGVAFAGLCTVLVVEAWFAVRIIQDLRRLFGRRTSAINALPRREPIQQST